MTGVPSCLNPVVRTVTMPTFGLLRDSRVNCPEKERILLHAYRLMEGLVDRDDPGVVDADGRINRRYLWQ